MTRFSLFLFCYSNHWRRKWQPTPVFLPGEAQGQRSLVGCCLWGLKRLSSSSRLLIMHNGLLRRLCSSLVQSLSHVSVTPWTAAHQASLSVTLSWSLLKLLSTESVVPSSHLILRHPLGCLWPIILTQSPSWWHTHCPAKMEASDKDSGKWSDMWCLLLTCPELFQLVVAY